MKIRLKRELPLVINKLISVLLFTKAWADLQERRAGRPLPLEEPQLFHSQASGTQREIIWWTNGSQVAYHVNDVIIIWDR